MENDISALFKERNKIIFDTDIAQRCISSLEFSSPSVREAFDRYLSVRNELYSCAGRPVSVNDIFNTANLYNRRREDCCACPVPELEPVVIGNGATYDILPAKSPLRMPCAGDMIMVFLGVTPELVSFVLSQSYVKLFFPSELHPVDLTARLRFGVWLDLTVLCDHLKVEAEDFLIHPTPGMYIAVIDGRFSQMRSVKLSGLCSYSAFVGKIISGPRIYISCCGRVVLDEVSVPYSPEALSYSLPQYDAKETLTDCREHRFKSDIAGFSFASSEIMPFSAPFYQSYYCVATLVCRLAAAGMPYEGARLFCNMGIAPHDSEGDALERALGIFAAAVDLKVYIKKCESFFTDSPCCIVSAFCPGRLPDTASRTDVKPYLLTPYKTTDGLPDTDDLMKMLLYVTKLREDGTVASMYEALAFSSYTQSCSYPACSVIAFSTQVIQGVPLTELWKDRDNERI